MIFTPGSASGHGKAFFETAAATVATLKVRAIFVTQFADQIPASLPREILHVRYAPFARLVPRASALVHHGGIGTAVQAMAAGVPQLVVPVSYDQPDNAARLERPRHRAHTAPSSVLANDAVVRDLRVLLFRVARRAPRMRDAVATAHFRNDTARDDALRAHRGDAGAAGGRPRKERTARGERAGVEERRGQRTVQAREMRERPLRREAREESRAEDRTGDRGEAVQARERPLQLPLRRRTHFAREERLAWAGKAGDAAEREAAR